MDVTTYVQDLWRRITGKTEDQPDYSEILAQIDEIHKSEALPEKPVLEKPEAYERLSYDAPTDEQLQKTAEDTLAGYKVSGESSIENEIASLIDKYSSQKKDNALTYESTLKALKAAYDTAVEDAHNDALRRGLARSSIATGAAEEIKRARAEKENDAVESYERKNAEIDSEIKGLESKKQKAMDEFNIKYTAKLTEQINKLKEQRADNEAAVIKYNNSLAEKENKESVSRAKAESDLYTKALAQFEKERELVNKPDAVMQDRIYTKIYEALRDKLLTMSAAKAREEIRNNPVFTEYLSDAYYYKLYDEFGRDRT